MKKLIIRIVAGIIGLGLSVFFIPGIENQENNIWPIVIFGIILGIINYFILPFIKLITFPLRIITLGLFTLIINIAIIWFIIDILSPIEIKGFIPLILAVFIILISNKIANIFL